MPTTYEYIKKGGGAGTLEAEDDDAALAALAGITDKEPTTGVQRATAVPGADDTTIADAYKDLNLPDYSEGGADATIESLLRSSGRTATAPINERQIYRDKLKLYQTEIDATNKIYADLLAKQQLESKGNLGSSRAIQARGGLLGSDFGASQTTKVKDSNRAAEELVQAENAAKIAEIMGRARGEASSEIAAKREAQIKSTQDYLTYLSTSQERKTNKLAGLATPLLDQGLTIEDIDPAQLAQIAKDYGVSTKDIIAAYGTEKKVRDEAASAAEMDAKDKLSFSLSEGQAFYEYDPKTGEYKQIASKAKTYAPTDGGGNAPGENAALYDGLSSKTATAVRSKVGAFKSEPLVTNFGTIQDGYNFASALADDTQNPADDQALIYALAKALDPGSVVREGEYATVQKYAQSWIDAYGNSVKNAALGTGFLGKDARQNIKKTIKQRYDASRTSYDQVRNQYVSGINALTGRANGANFLTDYATSQGDAGGDEGGGFQPGDQVEYNGAQYIVGDDGDTLIPL